MGVPLVHHEATCVRIDPTERLLRVNRWPRDRVRTEARSDAMAAKCASASALRIAA